MCSWKKHIFLRITKNCDILLSLNTFQTIILIVHVHILMYIFMNQSVRSDGEFRDAISLSEIF